MTEGSPENSTGGIAVEFGEAVVSQFEVDPLLDELRETFAEVEADVKHGAGAGESRRWHAERSSPQLRPGEHALEIPPDLIISIVCIYVIGSYVQGFFSKAGELHYEKLHTQLSHLLRHINSKEEFEHLKSKENESFETQIEASKIQRTVDEMIDQKLIEKTEGVEEFSQASDETKAEIAAQISDFLSNEAKALIPEYVPVEVCIGRAHFYFQGELAPEEIAKRLRKAQDYVDALPDQDLQGMTLGERIDAGGPDWWLDCLIRFRDAGRPDWLKQGMSLGEQIDAGGPYNLFWDSDTESWVDRGPKESKK